MHHDHAPDAEGDRLGYEPDALHREPEQPDRLPGQADQETGSHGLVRLLGGGLLLQHETEREEECRGESKGDIHATTL